MGVSPKRGVSKFPRDTVSPTRGVGGSGVAGRELAALFDGSTEYVDAPYWSPLSSSWSWELEISGAEGTGTQRFIAASADADTDPRIELQTDFTNPNGWLRFFVRDAAGTTLLDLNPKTDASIVLNEDWNVARVDAVGLSVSLKVNGVEVASGTLSAAIDWTETDNLAYAAGLPLGAASGYFAGQLRGVRHLDHIALQNRDVVQGDGAAVRGAPASSINLAGDHVIEYDYIQNAAFMHILGNDGSTANRIVNNVGRFPIYIDSSGANIGNVAGANADEHYHVRIVKNGRHATIYVNGVENADGAVDANAFAFDYIYSTNSLYAPSGQVIANLRIEEMPLTSYVALAGASGDYVSTPDSAAVSVTGDIDLIARVVMDDWTPTAAKAIVGKWVGAGNQLSYFLRLETGGQLRLFISPDGSLSVSGTSSIATGFSDGQVGWVRAHWSDSGDVVNFYVSSDETNDPSEVTWVLLGTANVALSSSGIFDSSSDVEVGSSNAGTLNNIDGSVYYVQIWSGDSQSGGTLVADCDPTKHNLLTYSEDLEGADWNNSGSVTVSTDGDWTVLSRAGVTAEYLGNATVSAPAASTELTFTIDVQSVGSDGDLFLRAQAPFSTNRIDFTFNVFTGVASVFGAVGVSGSVLQFEPLEGGGYRVGFTASGWSGSNNLEFIVTAGDVIGSAAGAVAIAVKRPLINAGTTPKPYVATTSSPLIGAGSTGETYDINGAATVVERRTLGTPATVYEYPMDETAEALTASPIAHDIGGSDNDITWQNLDVATDVVYLPWVDRVYAGNEGFSDIWFDRHGNKGPELISNGGPDFTVTTGWTGNGTSVISVVDGNLFIDRNGGVHAGQCDQSVVTEAGKTYLLVCNTHSFSDGLEIWVGGSLLLSASVGTHFAIFTASGASTDISIRPSFDVNATAAIAFISFIEATHAQLIGDPPWSDV